MITIETAITAYLGMREAIDLKNREAKEFSKSLKDKMSKLELFIAKVLHDSGADSTKVKGLGSAFKVNKDYVSISDTEAFEKFLATQMLSALQGYNYKTSSGTWQPDGEKDLADHVEKLLNSGAFDLLTVSANKNNCKTYMNDHEGIMPEGVKYTQETVIQIRKGK